MSSNARASGMPSSSAGKEVGDIVQTPDAPIKSWRYLGGGKWEPNDVVRFTATSPGGGFVLSAAGGEPIELIGVVRQGVGADLPQRPQNKIVHWYSSDYIPVDVNFPYDQTFPSGLLKLFLSGQEGAFHDPANLPAVTTSLGVGKLNGEIDAIRNKGGTAAAVAASTLRPRLHGRVNRCSETDTLSTWTKTGTGTAVAPVVTPYAGIAPDGTNTAIRVDFDAGAATLSTDQSYVLQFVPSLDVSEKLFVSVWLKAATPEDIGKQVRLANSNTASPFNGRNVTLTAEWQRHTGAPSRTSFEVTSWSIATRGTFTQAKASALVWRPDIRYLASSLLPAQVVRSATDYDTAGLPVGALFDGVNDALTCSAGGGSTAAWFFSCSLRVEKVGATQSIYSDAGTNAGYQVRISVGNKVEVSAGDGTATTTLRPDRVLLLGDRVAITAWHDGTNIYVQLDDGDITSAAFTLAAAGTAGFTIGKSNTSSTNYFGGTLFTWLLLKDRNLTADERDLVQLHVAGRAKLPVGL